MNLNSIVFPDLLPKVDLHGLDRDSARVAIQDFIRDSIKQKHAFILIVHGIGSGILYRATLDALKKDKNVQDFKLLNGNIGCTIVQIKV